MRWHIVEFEDLSWFPDAIREGGTDYLKYFLKAVGFYQPVIPLIAEGLEHSGENQLLDLCSGGGGPVEQISEGLSNFLNRKIHIVLSDKFPNTDAFQLISKRSGGTIAFKNFPVDATNVPADLKGFRTMFSAVHHFRPPAIKQMLRNAAEQQAGIALFDGGDKNLFTILGIVLFHPIAFLIGTPFFRPFKISRIVFTYLIPLIPITTVWDGCVSILRLYSPQELLQMAKEVAPQGYQWKSGKVKNKLGMRVTYLIGYPEKHTAY